MVKRIILWKIKDEQNNQANLDLLSEGLLSLKNSISEIVSVEVGLNYSSSDFDIVFIVAFDAPFSLKQLQLNPEFQKIFQMAQSISCNMISCDFMTESSGASPFNNNQNNNNGKRETLATSASPSASAFSLPFNNNQNNQAPTPSPMGGGAYNGFGSNNGENNGVNFTTSENINQIKFSNAFGGQAPAANQPAAIGTNDSWRCTKCGKTNSAFINMCSCGKRKPTDGMPNMPAANNLNKNMLQPQPNGMLTNTNMMPKMPASPINGAFARQMAGNNSADNWICPSCGKSNNDFMKVCICGHRKVEKGSANVLPAYGGNNPMNKPMMPLPKNPGENNVKSPNNNEFFNSFGNNNNATPGRPMGGPNPGGPMGGPKPNGPIGGPMGGPMGGPKPNGPMGGPMGGPKPNGPMGGPNLGGPMGGPKPNGPMGGPPGGRPMGGPPGTPTPGNRPMGGPPPQGRPINPPNARPMNNSPGGPMGGPNPGGPMGGPPGGRPMGGPNPQGRPIGGPNPGGPMGGPPGNGSTPPDSWKCPRCGKVLGNFVGQCICGQRKPSRTNMQF